MRGEAVQAKVVAQHQFTRFETFLSVSHGYHRQIVAILAGAEFGVIHHVLHRTFQRIGPQRGQHLGRRQLRPDAIGAYKQHIAIVIDEYGGPAGVVTLEICVLIGLPMNFANIIALPLLLGIGVAFKIYYVTAWRNGQTDLLQSPLTRAIFYSALTTATAFGSLWLSSHPGTSSMGKLLALSLVTTLAAAVLFQPALMGRPRDH